MMQTQPMQKYPTLSISVQFNVSGELNSHKKFPDLIETSKPYPNLGGL